MTIGAIIVFLIIGLVAGAVAKLLVPGDDPGGVLMTMVLGVVGAILGGFIGTLLTGENTFDNSISDLSTWVSAIGGSVVLLLLYRLFTRGSRRRVV